MTTYSWKTAASGDWATAGSWTPSGPPNATSADAVIGVSGSYVVTLASGTSDTVDTLRVVTSGATLDLRGTLALGGTAATLTLSAGTILASGVIQGGTVNVSGGVYQADGAFSYSGAYTQKGGYLGGIGTVTLKGTTTLTGGDQQDAGTTVLKGSTTIGATGQTGDAQYLHGDRVLENDAALSWIGGDIRFAGATLRNIAGATFSTTASGTMIDYNGTNAFANAGTFTKSAGAGATTIEVAFTNSGTVNASSGTLQISGGGGSSGKFNIAAGATLAFGHGGLFDVTAGGIAGTGTLLINGFYDFDILQFDVAAALAGPVTVTGGQIAFNQTASVAGAYTQTGGYVGGTGTVTLRGTTTLTGGDQQDAGTTVLKGSTTIGATGQTGDAQYLHGDRVLENDAALSWIGGDIRFAGATLRNIAGATFSTTANGTMIDYVGTNAFANAGTFTKSAGAGATTIEVAFTNSGTVNASSGTLQISGGGGSSGKFNIAADATLAFGHGGLFDVTAGGIAGTGTLLINGFYDSDILQFDVAAALAGPVTVTGGQIAFNQTASVAGAYTQTGGYVGGTGTVTLRGTTTLTGGDQQDAGTTVLKGSTTIGATGQTGDAQYLHGDRVLENDAALSWIGGDIRFAGATLRNIAGATFSTTANGTMIDYVGTNAFANAGTFTKSAGAGATTIEVAFTNSGTVNASSGTLQISGGGGSSGKFNIAAGATLAFGHGGLFDVTAGGIAGTGTLLINGFYDFDILQFDVAAALAGPVTVTGGQIAFNQTASVAGAYTQTGGYVGGTGTVTLRGTTTLTGGDQQDAGTTVLKGSTTIGATGQTGDAQYLHGDRVLENDAALSWIGGDIRFAGATLRNIAGATFSTTANGTMIDYVGTNAFANAGTFTKSAGAGATTIEVAFTNSGTVNASSGTLQISGGGGSSGKFNIAAGATLAFGHGGLFDVTAGGIAGTGTLLINGFYDFDILQFDVAAALAGPVTVTGGQIAFNQTASVAGAYTQTGGYVGGTGTVTLRGTTTLTGGDQQDAGTTVLKGSTTIGATGQTGDAQYLHGDRVLENDAALSWIGGDIRFAGATLRNIAGATFSTTANGTMIDYVGTNAFANAGTFTKSAGAGATTIEVAFTNSGTVNASSGTLSLPSLTNLSGTTLSGGAFSVGNGAVLQLANNATIATDATNITLSGGSAQIRSLNTSTNAQIVLESTLSNITAGGALRLLGNRNFTAVANAGSFSVAGVLQLGGGTVSATRLTIASTGTLLGNGKIAIPLTTSGLLYAQGGGTLAVSGSITGASALRADASSVLQVNEAAITSVTGKITLNGAGSAIQFGGAAPFTTLEASLTGIAAGGSFSVLGGRGYTSSHTLSDAGLFTVAGGTFTAAGITIAAGGRLLGSGTFTNALANSGAIEASGGTLKLSAGASGGGGVTIDAGGTLELAAATAAGTITDNGALKLDGVTLTATKLNVGAGGSVAGTGTIAGPVGNAGSIGVASGTLSVTDSLTETGTITVASGATLKASGGSLAGAITGAGTLSLAGSFTTSGTLAIATAIINAASVGVGSGPVSFLGTVTNNGTIATGGGNASFSASVGGTGRVTVGAGGGATLLAGAASTETVGFLASSGTIGLGAPLSFTGTIGGFALGDTIDLRSTLATSESFASGVLTVTGSGGTVASLRLSGSYTTASFHLGADGHGGTFVTHT